MVQENNILFYTSVAAILSIISTTNNACTCLIVEPFEHRKIYLNWL